MIMPISAENVLTSSTILLPEERQRAIRDRLASKGRVLAIDLARELHTSEDTIRRDLRELAALGICRRVYGGALPVSPASGALSERQAQFPERKAALAEEAVKLASPGQFIFLDAGSTNLAIARALPQNVGLVVAVNAPVIANALLERGGFEVLMVGGRLDAQAGAALGAQAVRDVRAMSADLCFLGACAVDPDATVHAFNFEDAAFKRALIERSRTIAVAAGAEKLGATASFEVMAGAKLDHLIVESDAEPALLARFEQLGIKVHRASRGRDRSPKGSGRSA
jgi:DeoR/GlpR family transcriptional regulator of sugar metabolism